MVQKPLVYDASRTLVLGVVYKLQHIS